MTPPRHHEQLQPPVRLRPRGRAPLIEADGLAQFFAIARDFQRGLPAEHSREQPAGAECSAPGDTGPQIQTSSDSQDPQDDLEPQSTKSAQSAADTPVRGALGENRKREQAPELRNVRCEDILEEFHVYARLHEVRRPRRQKLQSSAAAKAEAAVLDGAMERRQPRSPQVAVAESGSGWLRRAQAMGVGPLLQRGESVSFRRSPPRTSPVAEIWLRWKRLFDCACEVATPIGLDDARTHVEEFFVGSSIHGDNLTCRLARKLRQVEERFEAARLEEAAANGHRGEETPDLVPVPWRTRAVRALLCPSFADAARGRGMKTTLSLHVDSKGQTFVIFESSQTQSRWVRLSLMRLTLADPNNRVLALATRAASSTSVATAASGVECCLLFDDDNSLKRFTAMCNGY
jgi:hypothetical protein